MGACGRVVKGVPVEGSERGTYGRIVKWVFTCGEDMKKLIVAFRSFAKAPSNLRGHGYHNLHFCSLGCYAL